jgi:uncharacterized protein DUF222
LTPGPIPSTEDGEELPGSPPSPVSGAGTGGTRNDGTGTEGAWCGTGWPDTAGPGTTGTQVPGPGLAAVMLAAAGPAGHGLRRLSDEQLLDVIGAGRRLSSWGSWAELAAMAEYAGRHPHQPGDPGPYGGGAADEVGFATRMSWTSAGNRMLLGTDLRTRLPRTFAALRQGLIDMVHVCVISEATKYLSVEDCLAADAELAAAAQLMTPGQLRYLAMKVILRLDPDALAKRKEAAKRDSRVRVFREYSGNGGISGREMPADELLASWQNVEDWALRLREQGLTGSLQELQVLVVMDLLQGRDPAARLTAQPGDAYPDQDKQPADSGNPASGASAGDVPPCDGANGDDTNGHDDENDSDGQDGTDDGGWPQHDPDGPDGGGRGPRSPRGPAGSGRGGDGGPRLAAQVTIVVPFEAWMGWPTGKPGEVLGWGPAAPDTLNDLLAAAARDRTSRLCLTMLGPDRAAVAHGCAPGRLTLPLRATDQGIPGGTDPPWTSGPRRQAAPGDPSTPVEDMIRRLKIPLAEISRDSCGHEHAEDQYEPSRKLRHLVQARSPWCTAPGCTNPAARCDLDHTVPWDKGGISCECNLAPTRKR